jgi:hypothetical protein
MDEINEDPPGVKRSFWDKLSAAAGDGNDAQPRLLQNWEFVIDITPKRNPRQRATRTCIVHPKPERRRGMLILRSALSMFVLELLCSESKGDP